MDSPLALALDALYLGLLLSLPALAVGLLVSGSFAFLQSLTKLGEPALNAIPRALAVMGSLALTATWMASEIARFAQRVLEALPALVQ